METLSTPLVMTQLLGQVSLYKCCVVLVRPYVPMRAINPLEY